MKCSEGMVTKEQFEAYLDFLDEFWEMFGPIPPAPEKTQYKNVKL